MDAADCRGKNIRRPVFLAMIVTIGVGLCMVVAAGINTGLIWFPGCGFRELAGVPCPGCGTTGSLTHIMDGQLWSAMKTNPLAALSIVAGLFAVPLTLAGAFSIRLLTIRKNITRFGLTSAVGGLVFANWMYLVFAG